MEEETQKIDKAILIRIIKVVKTKNGILPLALFGL